MRLLLALVACMALAACANADGARPRLAADSSSSGFGGGYAGASAGLGNLHAASAPF